MILRHENHVALQVVAYLMHKLYQRCCAGKVENGIGLAAVPVTTGNQRQIALLPEPNHLLVFTPGPEAVQFQRVEKSSIFLNETEQSPLMLGCADALFVPIGMI